MVKNYVRLDKVGASAHYESFSAETAIVNGQFLNLGKENDKIGSEVVVATKAKEAKAPEAIACTVFPDYGYPDFDETQQELKVGKVGRALILEAGQMIALNTENAKGVNVGDSVTPAADGKGVKKAENTNVEIGTCVRKDHINYVGDVVVIRIKPFTVKGGE